MTVQLTGRAGVAGTEAIAVRLIEGRSDKGLASVPDTSNNRGVDPVVLALAQLVRDRWERDCAERARRRAVLRAVARRTE